MRKIFCTGSIAVLLVAAIIGAVRLAVIRVPNSWCLMGILDGGQSDPAPMLLGIAVMFDGAFLGALFMICWCASDICDWLNKAIGSGK